MIIRIVDNKVYVIKSPLDDVSFMRINSNDTFRSVDSLPSCLSNRWVVGANGEIIVDEEAEFKARVPQVITPRQCRLQLLSLGLLDEVETAIASDKAMQIWFEYSLDFQRSHEMVISMGQLLGMDEADMDNFFIEASKL